MFEELNVANDHNMLAMDLMHKIAKKHNANLIILDKKDLDNICNDYSFDDLEIIKDSPEFIAYKNSNL